MVADWAPRERMSVGENRPAFTDENSMTHNPSCAHGHSLGGVILKNEIPESGRSCSATLDLGGEAEHVPV